jgi:hypothetical protein
MARGQKAPRGPFSSLRQRARRARALACAELILGMCGAVRHWLCRTYNEMAVVRGTFVRITSVGPADDGASLSFNLARAVDVEIAADCARHGCRQTFHLPVVLPARQNNGCGRSRLQAGRKAACGNGAVRLVLKDKQRAQP